MSNSAKSTSRVIVIDAQAAQLSLERLVATEDQLTRKIAEGVLAGKKMTSEFEKLGNVQKNIAGIKDQLDKGLKPSLIQQEALVRKLNQELIRMGQGDKDFAAKAANFQKQNALLSEMRTNVNGVAKAQEELNGHSSTFGHIFEHVAEAFTAFKLVEVAFDKVKEFFSDGIKESLEFEANVAKLSNSLENAGRSDLFGVFTEEAEKLSQAFTRLKPNEITEVFTKLIDYGKLTKTQIDETTQVIINYAAKQRISLADATDVITRSLEGNSKGLKTYGINIKEAGSFTERYNLIVGQLGDKLKGAEAALQETNQGGWDTFKKNVSEVAKAVGDFFTGNDRLEEKQQALAVSAKREADSAQVLIDEYESLSKKTNKTAEDKQRLQQITASLVSTFGTSIVKINEETGALELNLSVTKDLIRQKLLLANSKATEIAAKYQKATEEENEALEQQKILLTSINAKQKEIGKTVSDVLKSGTNSNVKSEDFGTFNSKSLSSGDKQLLALNDQLSKFTHQKDAASNQLKSLGKDLEELGFKVDDVNKLFNPKTDNTVIGNGDPLADQKAEAAKKYEQLLKEAETFSKKIEELKFHSEQAQKSEDQKEIDAAKHKYEELLKEFDDYAKKLSSSDLNRILGNRGDIVSAEEEELAAIRLKQQEKLQKKQQEEFIKGAEAEYAEALRLSDVYFEEQKQIQAKSFTDGKINKEQYEANIKAIDAASKNQQLMISEDYSKYVKKAAEDVTKFKAEKLKEEVDATIKAYQAIEAERKLLEQLDKKADEARLQRKLIQAKASGDKDSVFKVQQLILENERAEKLRALDKEKSDALKAVTETGMEGLSIRTQIENDFRQQKAAINAEYDQKELDATTQHEINKLQIKLQFAQEIVNIFSIASKAQTDAENQELQQFIKNDDLKRKRINDLAKNKIITEQESKKQLHDLDVADDNKKKEIALKQFNRNQQIQTAQAGISLAQGVLKTIETFGPPIFPNVLGIAAMVLTVATGLAEIAAINSAKPPQLAKGGLLDGPLHSEGGMPIVNPKTGKKVAEIEGGEAILSRNTVSNNAEMVSALLNSSMHRNGARIQPFWKSRAYTGIDIPTITDSVRKIKKFESGGVFETSSSTTSAASNQSDEQLKALISQNIAINKILTDQLAQGIEANVSLHKINTAQDIKNTILEDATP